MTGVICGLSESRNSHVDMKTLLETINNKNGVSDKNFGLDWPKIAPHSSF